MKYSITTDYCGFAYVNAMNRFVFENVVNKKQKKNKIKKKKEIK